MKKSGILNAQLAGRMAALGHTQLVAIGDSGLPIPSGIPIVDLAVTSGVPSFTEVFDAILDELVIESHTIANETVGNPAEDWFDNRTDQLGERVLVSHEDLKSMLDACAFVVRTGEASPYANVILRCGVPF